jgi:hypothetical protein
MKEIEPKRSLVIAIEHWLERAGSDYESFLRKFASRHDIDAFSNESSQATFTGAMLCEIGSVAIGKAFRERLHSPNESYFARLWIPMPKGWYQGIKHTVFVFRTDGSKYLIDGTYKQINQAGNLLLLSPAGNAKSRYGFMKVERLSYEAMIQSISNYPNEINELAGLLAEHW